MDKVKEEQRNREYLMELFSEENQRRAVYKAMNQASEDQNRMLRKYEQMMKEKQAKSEGK
jgi:hypothetical protein